MTLLAAMAAHTTRLRCGMIVVGVTYRHPAVLANMAATIDHISGGRLEFGLGAAWYELEHDQYGIPFPRIGERMDMLDEACRICRSLWTEQTTTFEGTPLPAARRLVRAQAAAGPDAALDRRLGRAEDPAHRRRARDRLEHVPDAA